MAASISFQQIASLSSAASLTVPAGARKCWVQAEAQNVRFRVDGTAPTSAVGMRLLATGDWKSLDDPYQMANAQFIEESSSAKLNVTYFCYT